MGLDWHAQMPANEEHKEKLIKRWPADRSLEELQEGLKTAVMSPCEQVHAQRMRSVPGFRRMSEEKLARMKQMAEEMKQEKFPNQEFIDCWESMSLKALMDTEAEKWFCDTCPLLKALDGADSTGSIFLGATVSCCDFRGKRIGADDGLPDDIISEAYDERTPEEMLVYADKLEKEIRDTNESWRNENLRDAVHWLRTCAKFGVHMGTSY